MRAALQSSTRPAAAMRPAGRGRLRTPALLCLAALLLPAPACDEKPTPERIAAWKGQPDQHERLVTTIESAEVPLPLRGAAAGALTELGLVDRIESAVSSLELPDRAQVIPALVEPVARSLGTSDARLRSDARDALFALRRQATTEPARKAVDGALLPALERALRAGEHEGRTPVPEMLMALKSTAVPIVTRLLEDAKAPFEEPTRVLDKIGNAEERGGGGAALVARARALGAIPEPLWTAIGTLGGKEATAFLRGKVEAGGPDADAAATAMTKLRRDPELLPFALRIAGDRSARPKTREQMLELARIVGNEEARKGLVSLIASSPDRDFRFAVYKVALKTGGGKVVKPALEAFPAGLAFTAEEIRSELVKPLLEMGWDGRQGIFESFSSSSPLARLVAVWGIETSGFKSDSEHVIKLASDKRAPKGLPKGITVGKEATRVSAVLQKQQS